jgi:hypothetical protein
MVKKGEKLGYKRKSYIPNENQLRILREGRKKAYTEEAIIKRIKTRKERDNYRVSEQTKEKIRISLKARFPNGRPINKGCFNGDNKEENNGMWKGGMYNWRHKEARKIMENHMGRKLKKEEQVHHIDGNDKNNSLENLQIVSRSEHMKIHQERGDI